VRKQLIRRLAPRHLGSVRWDPSPASIVVAALVLWAAPVIADDAAGPAPIRRGMVEPGRGPANPAAATSLDQLSATRERPLFSPGRRPPQPPPVASISHEPAPHVPRAPPSLTLIGVVLDTEDARAVVRAGTEVIRARLGDEIDGWKVTEIDARRVQLSNEDRSVAFTLFAGAPSATAASMTSDHGPRGRDPARPGAKMRQPPD
jgi:hypothetical protein